MCVMQAGPGSQDFRSLCQSDVVETAGESQYPDNSVYIDMSTADEHANDYYKDRSSLMGWPDRCAAAITIGSFDYFQELDEDPWLDDPDMDPLQIALRADWSFYDNCNMLLLSNQTDAGSTTDSPGLRQTQAETVFRDVNMKLSYTDDMATGVCWLTIDPSTLDSDGWRSPERRADSEHLRRTTAWPVCNLERCLNGAACWCMCWGATRLSCHIGVCMYACVVCYEKSVYSHSVISSGRDFNLRDV